VEINGVVRCVDKADESGDVGSLSYSDAAAELEAILDELEDDAIDVDHLAERVARAAVLIRLCRERIVNARMQVEQIVAELDEEPPAEGEPGP
jgi:exodeoxyribonuclease VII small subunit